MDNEPSIRNEDRPCPGHSSCGAESANPPEGMEMNETKAGAQMRGSERRARLLLLQRSLLTARVPSWDPAGGAQFMEKCSRSRRRETRPKYCCIKAGSAVAAPGSRRAKEKGQKCSVSTLPKPGILPRRGHEASEIRERRGGETVGKQRVETEPLEPFRGRLQ